jgi:hypothetical protein
MTANLPQNERHHRFARRSRKVTRWDHGPHLRSSRFVVAASAWKGAEEVADLLEGP